MAEASSRGAKVRDVVTWQRLVGITIALLVLPLVFHLGSVVVPGAGSYVVLSDSMEPTVAGGSLIVVLETGDYERGDVITYTHDGATVTHRIVAVEPDGYRTKGDANQDSDQYRVTETAVHGEMIVAIPFYGRLLQTVASNRFLVIAFTGLIVVALGAMLLGSGLQTDQAN